MTQAVVDRFRVYDADTHVSEPTDLWTSRMPAKFGDLVPHVIEVRGEQRWLVGEKRLFGVGLFAMAGWKEFIPGHPPTLEDADKAAWDPAVRLQRMDEYGIHAQVLYPNLIGFFVGAFAKLNDPELTLACVQAYNDFMAEFASTDPDRFVPVMMLPYWDIEASLREMDRCVELGHRGIVGAGRLDGIGLPALRDEHWDPLWAAAQERGLPMNFHIGFNAEADPSSDKGRGGSQRTRADFAEGTAQSFMANGRTLAEVICSGILHRFPKLKVVSVESGAGWLPFFLEALDWQWLNSGVREDFPDRELPSTYFRRQAYATFWFERESLRQCVVDLQDNLMFSTDFPHPTSQTPGPASFADNPRVYAEETLASLPDEVVRKVVQDNAKAVYQLS